jgi:hypothetical protein
MTSPSRSSVTSNDATEQPQAERSDRSDEPATDLDTAQPTSGENSVLDLSPDPDRELTAARAQQAGGKDQTDRADDGMAPLINNTGDDGGAASG